MGCHVAALDWAMWHLINQLVNAMCQPLIHPRQLSVLPCHLPRQPLTSPVPRVTLPVVTRVTSGLVQLYAQMSKYACHVSLPGVAMCPLYGPATCHPYGHATSASVHTVRIAQSAIFFACLTYRTERDIFSIQSPFDEVNIPPESRRRDGRNGIGFITFRALSFLSIFQALSDFWIQFWIKWPTLEECYVSWRRASNPRKHKLAWILAWMLGVFSGTFGLQ
jgi:hypothetical protein